VLLCDAEPMSPATAVGPALLHDLQHSGMEILFPYSFLHNRLNKHSHKSKNVLCFRLLDCFTSCVPHTLINNEDLDCTRAGNARTGLLFSAWLSSLCLLTEIHYNLLNHTWCIIIRSLIVHAKLGRCSAALLLVSFLDIFIIRS
jgi:hypothetical protein